MKLHTTDDKEIESQLDSPTMGLRLDAVTFTGADFHEMLQWDAERLREYLGILYTRFEPWSDKKKPEIIFAPGCFDNFDGTQEELQELIAQIHQMVNDDTLLENSEPLSPEEEARVYEMLRNKEQRQ